jgi:hypothetical protein
MVTCPLQSIAHSATHRPVGAIQTFDITFVQRYLQYKGVRKLLGGKASLQANSYN